MQQKTLGLKAKEHAPLQKKFADSQCHKEMPLCKKVTTVFTRRKLTGQV